VWLCRRCHTITHHDDRMKAGALRRTNTDPCTCGKPSAIRQMCKGCYARWRAANMKATCSYPGCERNEHTRGLCSKHRQTEDGWAYAQPPKRRGPKPSL
jgi:hypothetical protein